MRRSLFAVSSVVFGLLLLVALELGLRAAGVGGSYPLFVDAEGLAGYRQANPEVIRRYLDSTGRLAAGIEPIPFLREKPEDGLRIVVQGGSSAAGFPYGRWGGLAGMLGDRLEVAFPERQIEVITTAMAAVNSYTLLDLVDEIIEVEPDAVLIYAGHNEYLGVLGVGSAFSIESSRFASRLYLRLRRLRVYQLIHRFVTSLSRLLEPGPSADRKTLFAQAGAGARIPFGSAAYQQGVEQFESNLQEILVRYRKAEIPVYLGTLVSNERDQEPFSVVAGGGEERNAEVWFARGRSEEQAERLDAAREAYRKARDLDALRFRAPSEFNRVIRTLADRHGAVVVELERAFAQASPRGIIGAELLSEHVHPNAEGYFLLADAYFEALREDALISLGPGAPSRAEALRDMPITALDRRLAEYSILELKAGYPFRESAAPFTLPPPSDAIDELARRRRGGELTWLESMESLMQLHLEAGRTADAVVVARLAAQAYPMDPVTNFAAGRLYLELGDLARARRYLRRSVRAAPGDPKAARVLARVERRLGAAGSPATTNRR